MNSEWFKDWFNSDYSAIYGHRDSEDANFQIETLLSTLHQVRPGFKMLNTSLDIGCGNGRHLEGLTYIAKAVFGVDLSTSLLQEAQARVNQISQIYLARTDMRVLPFQDRSVDLITSFFTSFGYFQNDTEHQKTLSEWSRVLTTDGLIFLDLPDDQSTIASLIPYSHRQLNCLDVVEQRSYSDLAKRVNKEILITRKDGTTAVYRESVRLFSAAEIVTLAESCNLKIEAIQTIKVKHQPDNAAPRQIVLISKQGR